MSKQISQSSLETSESNEAGHSIDIALPEEKKVEKPSIVIKTSELNIVMNATRLTRNEAIELIQKADGDIKAALKLYLQ